MLAYGSTGSGALGAGSAADVDSTTLVEAVSDGWWYSLFLPDHRLVVAFMTDADLLDATGARRADGLRALLDRAPATAPECRRPTRPSTGRGPRPDPRTPVGWTTVAGPDWLAVGDAAVAFDPLASYGIAAALGEGFYAARRWPISWAVDATRCSITPG